MLTLPRFLLLLLAVGMLSSCANTPVDPKSLPSGLALPKGIKLPLERGIGIYLSAGVLQHSEIFRNEIIQRGRFTREGVDAVAKVFFKTVDFRDRSTKAPIQLMLDLDPKWKFEAGNARLELSYRLFDAKGAALSSGTKTEVLAIATNAPNVLIKNMVIKATQQVMVEVTRVPAAANALASTTVAEFPPRLLINEEAPYLLGTGFYINGSGQLLTAASIVKDCLRIDVGADAGKRSGIVNAQSPLLNLAILNSGGPVTGALSAATARPSLGAATTSISYGRDKDGKSTRGLSFGNVTGYEGSGGAFGVFQFSAATKPQTVGAPIVDPDGRLIGVFAGGYTYEYLQKNSVMPANTYQGLNGDIVTEFLRRNRIAYSTEPYADSQTPVDRAGAATVQIACYQ